MNILTHAQATKIKKVCIDRLAKYVENQKIKTLVLGISGGLDSAVVSGLALRTIAKLKRNSYECGYIFDYIDVNSNPADLQKARELAKTFHFKLGEYHYTDWYQDSPLRLQTHSSLPRIKVANGNLKCRIRMLHLYDRAQLFEGVVMDTDDLSELLMGFWTKHGDVGDLKIIQQLTKEEVRDLGEYLKVPESILKSAPGDGLGVTPGNKAEDQLGMEYLKIDYAMSRLIQNGFKIDVWPEQLEEPKYRQLFIQIAKEISETPERVRHVAAQAKKTAFKRINGDDAVNLVPDRRMLFLPELGSVKFNSSYLAAIKAK